MDSSLPAGYSMAFWQPPSFDHQSLSASQAVSLLVWDHFEALGLQILDLVRVTSTLQAGFDDIIREVKDDSTGAISRLAGTIMNFAEGFTKIFRTLALEIDSVKRRLDAAP